MAGAARDAGGAGPLAGVAQGSSPRGRAFGCGKSVTYSPNGKTLTSASADNTIRFWTATGDPLLILRALRSHNASYAFTPGPTPYIELLGPEAETAAEFPICRIGSLSFPFELCRERFEVPGLFAKALAGDGSYAEP